VGNHPDDIEAWIKERKKKFPTREKVAKREEKIKRDREEGAVVAGGAGVGDGKRQRTEGEAQVKVGDKTLVNDKAVEPPSSMSNLLAGYGSSSDEDETATATATATAKLNDQKASSIGDTKDDSSAMGANAPITANATEDPASKFKSKPCRFFLRNGTCKNGDNCTYIHDIPQHKAYKANAETRKQKQSQRDKARIGAQKEMNLITTGRKQTSASSMGSMPGGQTLLRKLLQTDIRRERSLGLQLLRYIVDCNYLQEKREASKEESEDQE